LSKLRRPLNVIHGNARFTKFNRARGNSWAESKGITDEADCEAILVTAPNRTSFYEGCLVYVEDPSRGADEDDDGDEIED
jgi:hypothetical protein